MSISFSMAMSRIDQKKISEEEIKEKLNKHKLWLETDKKEGEAVIYMNPNIGKELIPKIKTAFGITIEPIIKYDRSEHYKCYLDR